LRFSVLFPLSDRWISTMPYRFCGFCIVAGLITYIILHMHIYIRHFLLLHTDTRSA
jgi:hypothetical protein